MKIASLVTAFVLFLGCTSGNPAPFGAASLGHEEITPHIKIAATTPDDLPMPTRVRHSRLWKDPPDPDPGFSSCQKLNEAAAPGDFSTVLSDTFTTGPSTNHIEVSFTAQWTTFSGEVAYEGIIGRGTVIQNNTALGQTTQRLPGLCDDFCPFIGRRTEGGSGQQTFSGYQGVVMVEPSKTTTVILEMLSTSGPAYVCFLNMSVRY